MNVYVWNVYKLFIELPISLEENMDLWLDLMLNKSMSTPSEKEAGNSSKEEAVVKSFSFSKCINLMFEIFSLKEIEENSSLNSTIVILRSFLSINTNNLSNNADIVAFI